MFTDQENGDDWYLICYRLAHPKAHEVGGILQGVVQPGLRLSTDRNGRAGTGASPPDYMALIRSF